jgi:hypothetical protein
LGFPNSLLVGFGFDIGCARSTGFQLLPYSLSKAPAHGTIAAQSGSVTVLLSAFLLVAWRSSVSTFPSCGGQIICERYSKGAEHLIPNGVIGETPVVGGDDTFRS